MRGEGPAGAFSEGANGTVFDKKRYLECIWFSGAGRLQVYEKPVQVLKLKRFRAVLCTEADDSAQKAEPKGDSR